MKKGILALIFATLVGGGINFAMADSEGFHGHDREFGEGHHGKEGKHCKKHGEFRLEKMREELGLSDEQVKQITSIREKYQPRMQELREKSKANREKLREMRHADEVDMGKVKDLAKVQGDLKTQKIILMAEKHNEIHSVFTKEQLGKLKEMKQKFHEHRS